MPMRTATHHKAMTSGIGLCLCRAEIGRRRALRRARPRTSRDDARNRTPQPPPGLAPPSPMSSTPLRSSAPISLVSESTLPRMTSRLASMRWMVGTERPQSSASCRWSIPSSARAARTCAAVSMATPRSIRKHQLRCLLREKWRPKTQERYLGRGRRGLDLIAPRRVGNGVLRLPREVSRRMGRSAWHADRRGAQSKSRGRLCPPCGAA